MKLSTIAVLLASTFALAAPSLAQASTMRHHMRHHMMMRHHMHMMTGGRMVGHRNF